MRAGLPFKNQTTEHTEKKVKISLKKTIFVVVLIVFVFPAFVFSEIVINEIAFDESKGSPDWVELFNTGPDSVLIDGWILEDEDTGAGNEIYIQLSTPVPVGAYVVVLVDAYGIDDTDFSDHQAWLYSGTGTTVNLAASKDELSLYAGLPMSSSTIKDFVAWVTKGEYNGEKDQVHAVAAGIWTNGEAVVLADTGHGYSLARSSTSFDTNRTSDFSGHLIPTPGFVNVVPEMCDNGIDDDNDGQVDCTDSDCSEEPICAQPLMEICSNGHDDDNDGQSDCADGDCLADPFCRQTGVWQQVVINEIAWSGTAAGSSHEWVELYNTGSSDVNLTGWVLETGDEDWEVVLSSRIPAFGYYLMERSTDTVVSNVQADSLYTGALSNRGEDLFLKDISSRTIDAVCFESEWPAGSKSPDYLSMERINPLSEGNSAANWRSNDMMTRNGLDANGVLLNGTPKAQNSVYGYVAPALTEICFNKTDDDEDGAIDCADADCVQDPFCLSLSQINMIKADENKKSFSPYDKDKAFQSVPLFFNTRSGTVVKTIRIVNIRGETVKEIMNNDRGADGVNYSAVSEGFVSWDGRDQHGHVVPIGIYIVYFEGVDAVNGDRVTAKDTVVVGR